MVEKCLQQEQFAIQRYTSWKFNCGIRTLALAALMGCLALSSPVDGSACTNLVPGLTRQLRGVDASSLDLIPMSAGHKEDGYKSPVIQFTCAGGKTESIGGKTYNVPDQVWVMSSVPSGSLTSEVQVVKSSNQARNSFSVNAGLDVDAKKFAFSSSFSYSKTQETLLKKEKTVESVSAAFSGRRVDLKTASQLSLGPTAQGQVDALPSTYAGGYSKYEAFIKQFGTHYTSVARYGGVLSVTMETSSSYVEKKTSDEIKVQASATFSKVVTVKGGTAISNANVDSEFTSNTQKTVMYFGGSANLLAGNNGISAWQPTIASDPWLYASTLKPISDLITDAGKKTAMQQAVNDYLMRQYVDVELRRVLNVLPTSYHTKDDVAALFTRINTFKTKYPLVESEVDQLGRDVDKSFGHHYQRYDFYMHPEWLRGNHYDKEMSFECPAGKVIAEMKSSHSGWYEDREWFFKCSYVAYNGLRSLDHCVWSGYANNYDANMDYTCPGDKVFKGMKSVHSNWYEDRRYKFQCCSIEGGPSSLSCSWSGYANSLDGYLEVKPPFNKLFHGANSYHDSYYEDRRFKFNMCVVE